jgi:hypothetical protein
VVGGREAQAWLEGHARQGAAVEARRADCGAPRRAWGMRKPWRSIQEIRSRLTLRRTRWAADHNHHWTRRIVSRAVGWRCGTVAVTLPEGSLLFGHPWSWTDFEAKLRYKLEERGMVLAPAT